MGFHVCCSEPSNNAAKFQYYEQPTHSWEVMMFSVDKENIHSGKEKWLLIRDGTNMMPKFMIQIHFEVY